MKLMIKQGRLRKGTKEGGAILSIMKKMFQLCCHSQQW